MGQSDWEHERLYALKGEIAQRGVKSLTGISMPVFEKRRFQHGVLENEQFQAMFPADEAAYRGVLENVYA